MTRMLNRVLNFGLPLALTLGCTIKEERADVFGELDRLRILGIQSDPADVAPAEQTTLRVLAFDPEARELSYEWSWCPVPDAPSNGYGCELSEAYLAELWVEAALPGEPPSFSLGQASSATFTNPLTPELVDLLCDALASEVDDLPVPIECGENLLPSVIIRVRAGDGPEADELVGWRELPLLLEAPAEEERNENPNLEGELKVVRVSDEVEIPIGGTLHRGELYRLQAGFSEAEAEVFLPPERDGLPPPEPRRENMEMDWFVTAGTIDFIQNELGNDTRFDDVENLDDAEQETDYVGGLIEFEKFVSNFWYFPVNDGTPSGEVTLFLVARDERKGIGWTSYTFNYEDGVP